VKKKLIALCAFLGEISAPPALAEQTQLRDCRSTTTSATSARSLDAASAVCSSRYARARRTTRDNKAKMVVSSWSLCRRYDRLDQYRSVRP
jgi:hypothetical protein